MDVRIVMLWAVGSVLLGTFIMILINAPWRGRRRWKMRLMEWKRLDEAYDLCKAEEAAESERRCDAFWKEMLTYPEFRHELHAAQLRAGRAACNPVRERRR
jgi:hypothetical protein